jgi:ABC-type phosphate transport system substrate-binding protein
MRKLRTLVASTTMALALTTAAIGPAMADPINPTSGKAVTPTAFDVVGVGADTTASLIDQLAVDYDGAHKANTKANPYIYSWDATNPKTQAVGDLISTKLGCAKIVRPDGSGAGITDLQANTADPRNKAYQCISFARSASGRSTQPTGKGGVLFVALAEDAVTFASQQTSNAPASLTTKQLTAIYSCTVTTWNQVGGTSHATIAPYLPPTTSGIRTFFLKEINVTTPGPCVNKLGTPQQNEGTSKLLKTANAIFPYSVADYIAQRYHSPACGKKPTKTQNRFGCDERGTLKLNSENGTKPTVGTGAKQTINPKFSAPFVHTVYDVVRYSTSTANHIPAALNRFFGTTGYFCANSSAKTAVADYGFLKSPVCGLGF